MVKDLGDLHQSIAKYFHSLSVTTTSYASTDKALALEPDGSHGSEARCHRLKPTCYQPHIQTTEQKYFAIMPRRGYDDANVAVRGIQSSWTVMCFFVLIRVHLIVVKELSSQGLRHVTLCDRKDERSSYTHDINRLEP